MSEADPHFIGWLPMPRPYARFLTPVAALVLVGVVVAAVLVARTQRSPGNGRWEDPPITFVGIVYAEPYAMIRVQRGDVVETVLLVEDGKFGANERVRPHDGQPVRATGTRLTRDGWRMLELANDGLQPADLSENELAPLRRSPPRSLGRVTLRGEIVDSKCYLGAMKPGGGRTHRGCARLCLKGGVPPLFVTHDRDGKIATYLLTDATGGPLDQDVFGLVGDEVALEGELEVWGDIAVLKAASQSIQRR